ncbi:MAG: hypothetical protein GY764_05290 [Halieaceae bacterium]|nr:hypothetical protein [Halieaceae bacterium]
MAYDVDGLLARFRLDQEDTAEPYLWSDAEILAYFDEAQAVLAEDADLLRGELTIAYSASDLWLDIPEYVTRIRQANGSDGTKLYLYNFEEWEDGRVNDDYGQWVSNDDWEADTGVYPEALITDIEVDQLRMYPIPTADGSVKARIFRGPTTFMEEGSEPELVNRQHQSALLNYARYIAYQKHDSQTYNPSLAAEQLAIYTSKKDRLITRTNRRQRRTKTVAYGGIE